MIYVVSLYYPPESNPPANRMNHLVRVMVQAYGAENVRVVTGRPNYPHGKLASEFKWRFFKRGRGQWGEHIDHIYEFPAPFQGLYLKTVGLLSFAASVFFYFLFKRIKREDLVVITSGPVFPVYSMLCVSKLKRSFRYVLDVRDLWPQVVAGMGFLDEDSWVYRRLMRWSDAAYRNAYRLIGNSDGICAYLSQVAPDSDVELLYNPVDMESLHPPPDSVAERYRREHPEIFGNDGACAFVFTGTFSSYLGIMTLLEALRIISAKRDDFRFVLIGQGEEETRMRAYIAENKLADCVRLLPFMPREELGKYIGAADYCYASLRDRPTLRYAIPTKIIEYLACGKRVLAVLKGGFADLLMEKRVATVVEPGDPEKLAVEIEHLVDQKNLPSGGEGLREFVDKRFGMPTFERSAQKLFSEFLSLSANESKIESLL